MLSRPLSEIRVYQLGGTREMTVLGGARDDSSQRLTFHSRVKETKLFRTKLAGGKCHAGMCKMTRDSWLERHASETSLTSSVWKLPPECL